MHYKLCSTPAVNVYIKMFCRYALLELSSEQLAMIAQEKLQE